MLMPTMDEFEAMSIPEPMSGCWLWLAHLNAGGYGVLSRGANKKLYAHRVAWEIYRHVIPAGLKVLHRCDNPACCNPDHLFLGTQTENMADMHKKGRRGKTGARGEANGRAKLTPADVSAIRESTLGRDALSEMYGVTTNHINKVRSGYAWAAPSEPREAANPLKSNEVNI